MVYEAGNSVTMIDNRSMDSTGEAKYVFLDVYQLDKMEDVSIDISLFSIDISQFSYKYESV